MSRGLLDVSEFIATGQGSSDRACADIFASAQMEAEVPRVLHALAVPEYLEAWMMVPDADRIECRSDPRSFDRFCIDLFSAGRRQGSIHASCLLTKPNRITYLWESASAGRARSLVEIRLWMHLTRCTLKLKHSGLNTWEEREWHSRMWQQSLSKLCVLMEGTRVTPLQDLQ